MSSDSIEIIQKKQSDAEARRRKRAARPAKQADLQPGDESDVQGFAKARTGRNVLMVDLNIFPSFPTLAIGLLTSTLRNNGHVVRILCPLAYDVPALERERRETRIDDIRRRLHVSSSRLVRAVRETLAHMRRLHQERPHPRVLKETERELDKNPEVLLISAYLYHYNSVREMAKLAKARGIPVIVGGPMFNLEETAEEWRKLDGITAVVGAESDLVVAEIVETACEGGDLTQFPGVTTSDGRKGEGATPLRFLDQTPIPDYSDFPWDRYPVRILPILTDRGCQWDRCLFCSDVISASGRTFRTRTLETVLLEMQELSRRHGSTDFAFIDLKLNSWPEMMRGLGENIQRYVQGAEWVGTVHVDQRTDNGLSYKDLQTAVKGGMRRVSFGLESGSQRLLDSMDKGTSVEMNSEFIRNAYQAGLSVRASMFRGFPGETVEDMRQTADFLEKHEKYMDRIRFVEFKLSPGTPIYDEVVNRSDLAKAVNMGRVDNRRSRVNFWSTQGQGRAYRKEKYRALASVYRINQRHLRETARQFDGVM